MSPNFHRYQDRYNSFCHIYNIEGKRCSWPYRVIPTKAMAQMGFEFQPTINGDILSRDCVSCSFCGGKSYDFHDCRVKPLTATLAKVLEKHLQRHSSCLHSALKLVLLKSFWKSKPIEWREELSLGDPHSNEMVRLRQWTFNEGWIHGSERSISSKSMAKAGLLRYELGLSSPELQEEHPDATYCIYCSKIIGSWEPDDDPVWEHFVCSNGGRCHFFQTMADTQFIQEMKSKYDIEGLGSDENVLPSLDYYETFGTQLKKFEDQTSIEESQIKRGRPKSRDGSEPSRELKKRGRPRKEKQTEDEPDVANSNPMPDSEVERPPPIKRKRGRPKKIIDEDPSVVKQKRPRGRPRKDFSSLGEQGQLTNSMSPPSTKANSNDLMGSITAQTPPLVEPLARPQSKSPSVAQTSQHTSRENIDEPLKEYEALLPADGDKTPPKRRIRIRQNQNVAAADILDPVDSDVNSTKSIVLNFNNRTPESKNEARNPIIDDSFDAFSFSTHGNSEFIIPESAFQSKINSKRQFPPELENTGHSDTPENQESSSLDNGAVNLSPASKSYEPPIGVLDNIDMNVNISEDSDDDDEDVVPRSDASKPSNPPKKSIFIGAQEKMDLSDRLTAELSSLINNATPNSAVELSANAKNDSSLVKSDKILEETSETSEERTVRSLRVSSLATERLPGDSINILVGRRPNYERLSSNSENEIKNNHIEESTAVIRAPDAVQAQQTRNASTTDKSLNPSAVREDNVSTDRGDITYSRLDESRALLGNYFRKLLRYINLNDASLSNEIDGDLSFFVKHMPQVEKELTFSAWIDRKELELREEFDRDYKMKIAKLERQFQVARSYLENIDNDDFLLKMAETYNIPTNSPRSQ
ncbi:LANO_0G06986g1_1 [Lachancea nothofagi CBS 11611]|uniref:LANO_0G06986g1_1 n=1 Tax=Lachancea nothofagi CBS 11611 TaxID=1266666 RepID=A0A1G4KHE0_9SACH|nr:LANO_0G06986g1_1 [Lachancea nothofagi CBS 11611]